MSGTSRLFEAIATAVLKAVTGNGQRRKPATGSGQRRTPAEPSRPRNAPNRARAAEPAVPQSAAQDYPGDFHGQTELRYDPHPDSRADPGEVVWTWVPYEEDHSQGKDRPVLVVGREDPWLLAVPMTSQDHDRDAAQEASQGRYWVEIGSGDWDSQGRASEVRVNRIVRVDPAKIRRIAARISRERFEAVAAGIRQHW